MNDNDRDAAYVDAMTSRGTLLTYEQVEDAIALVEAYVGAAIDNGPAVTEDDQNAIVADAAFRWLMARMGSAAIVTHMMSVVGAMYARREPPQPPEAA